MMHSLTHCLLSLRERPSVALMAVGIHGPNSIENFRSDRHWWLHLYRYRATLRVNSCALVLRPGYVSLIPPGTEIEYDFGERATHLCAHFTLPKVAEEMKSVPVVQDFGDDFPRLYHSLEEASGWFASNPARAELRLWDILWQVADRTTPDYPPIHPHPVAVERVRHLIELRLGEPLSVKHLADEVGISHNQLTRLFHATVGDTVIGYIRGRRVQRAQHLLEHTTLPIKTIAAQVGIEDTRHFYKVVHAILGQSPTQVRHNAQTG
jgi:AraC family transcriptional regulator